MSDMQKWLLFASLVLSGWVLYLLAPILSPFLLGILFAYLGDPLVDRLENLNLSRTLSVIIVFTVMLLGGIVVLLILIPLLHEQLLSLLGRLPSFINWIQDVFLPWLSAVTGTSSGNINLDAIRQAISENWRDVGNILGFILQKISHSGQLLMVWLASLILIPVVTFYLLRDWDKLVSNIHDLIPRQYEPYIVRLSRECDNVLAEFLRGQLMVMLALGVMYSFGLWIAGLEFALLVGMLAGLVSFVPYLGAIVGIAVAGILAFIQFHDLIHLLYIGLVFGIGQAIEGMLLSPWLVGDRIGLHPVAVIFAVMAGGQLFGLLGVLLALPVAAVITVLLRFIHQGYLESEYYTP